MSEQITIIRPESKNKYVDFKELWQFRELLFLMLGRDIKVRYKQTVLGIAWAVLQPLVTMLIFSIIFGRLAKIPSDGLPYPLFVFSGLIAWTFFSTAVSMGANSMVNAGPMISKVYFPRLIIPIASIGVGAVDFLISFLLLLIIMAFYGIFPNSQILLLPIFLFGLFLTIFGLSAWLSSLTVMYRDFRFIVPFMLQIWMYLTPVIYPLSFIPEKWQWLVYLNPVSGWVSAIRSSVLGTEFNLLGLCSSVIFTIVILIIGLNFFKQTEQRFADVI